MEGTTNLSSPWVTLEYPGGTNPARKSLVARPLRTGRHVLPNPRGNGIDYRRLITRVSQIMSCNPRFSESKPAMMYPMNRIISLRIFAK